MKRPPEKRRAEETMIYDIPRINGIKPVIFCLFQAVLMPIVTVYKMKISGIIA